MLFNSFTFIIFLPIVFLSYWFICHTCRGRNILIVCASFLFYGWWDWRFLLLIAFTTLCSFVSGILVERWRHDSHRTYMVTASNIIINLCILSVFKYFNFFVQSLAILLNAVGVHLDWISVHIILPVGISFYTFQALSYTIDVHRQTVRPTHDIMEFTAFISFFPQLVAGPIERATNLLPQFQHNRRFDYDKAVDGMRQMLWGFFKKVVVADTCAHVVDMHWEQYESLSVFMLVLMSVLFAIQIYGDFSGYSDIAIGCSRLFGFDLKRNFRYPYFATNIVDFWRRWHISLTTWLRDYVYIPLGGSRNGQIFTLRNIFIVWGISGLWHGANWTYVVWGIYHACLLCAYRLLNARNSRIERTMTDIDTNLFPSFRQLISMLVTFAFVVLGWIFFRSISLDEALHFIKALFSNSIIGYNLFGAKALLWAIPLFLVEWLQRDKEHALQFPRTRFFAYAFTRWCVYLAILAAIALKADDNQTFIYFQF